MDLMEAQNITIQDLAKKLDIATSQVYYWNRNGISKNNKHFPELQRILPGIIPKETTLRIDEEEDRRYNSGRKKNKLKLSDTNLIPYVENEFSSTLFPKIIKRKKDPVD